MKYTESGEQIFTDDARCTASPISEERAGVRRFPSSRTCARTVAALKHGRNSLGVALDSAYSKVPSSLLLNENTNLFGHEQVQTACEPVVALDSGIILEYESPSNKIGALKKPVRKVPIT